jgi:hypothetical protein
LATIAVTDLSENEHFTLTFPFLVVLRFVLKRFLACCPNHNFFCLKYSLTLLLMERLGYQSNFAQA